jgi:hypothetical protein
MLTDVTSDQSLSTPFFDAAIAKISSSIIQLVEYKTILLEWKLTEDGLDHYLKAIKTLADETNYAILEAEKEIWSIKSLENKLVKQGNEFTQYVMALNNIIRILKLPLEISSLKKEIVIFSTKHSFPYNSPNTALSILTEKLDVLQEDIELYKIEIETKSKGIIHIFSDQDTEALLKNKILPVNQALKSLEDLRSSLLLSSKIEAEIFAPALSQSNQQQKQEAEDREQQIKEMKATTEREAKVAAEKTRQELVAVAKARQESIEQDRLLHTLEYMVSTVAIHLVAAQEKYQEARTQVTTLTKGNHQLMEGAKQTRQELLTMYAELKEIMNSFDDQISGIPHTIVFEELKTQYQCINRNVAALNDDIQDLNINLNIFTEQVETARIAAHKLHRAFMSKVALFGKAHIRWDGKILDLLAESQQALPEDRENESSIGEDELSGYFNK